MNIKKFTKDALKIVLITILCMSVIETYAYISIKLHGRGSPANQNISTIKKLYQTNEPEMYKEMLSEIWDYSSERLVYEPFVEFKESEFEGKFLNISTHGYRRSSLQKSLSDENPKIFVFGGSTTFGYGVKDEETIASYMSELINENGIRMSVFNFGAAFYYSTQERILFEKLLTQGHRPDIVVFIDGLNDFYHYKMPDSTAFSDRLRVGVGGGSTLDKAKVLLRKTYTYRKIAKIREKNLDPKQFYASDNELMGVISRLETNRNIIASICEAYSIRYLFVQQPVPTYAYENSRRIVPVADQLLGNHLNSKRGYEIYAKMIKRNEVERKHRLFLQNLNITQNQYIDTVHYSPEFNRTIAENIVKSLFPETPY